MKKRDSLNNAKLLSDQKPVSRAIITISHSNSKNLRQHGTTGSSNNNAYIFLTQTMLATSSTNAAPPSFRSSSCTPRLVTVGTGDPPPIFAPAPEATAATPPPLPPFPFCVLAGDTENISVDRTNLHK